MFYSPKFSFISLADGPSKKALKKAQKAAEKAAKKAEYKSQNATANVSLPNITLLYHPVLRKVLEKAICLFYSY